MGKLEQASVHGRFQPFHNGHLDYVRQAADRCDHLFVGLTQIYQPETDNSGIGRDASDSNPLTFFERKHLVESALVDEGVKRSQFEIIPFPIEEPTRLPEFLPINITCFTTIVTQWNNEKIARLRQVGYRIETLDVSPLDNNRVTSGSEIRSLLRNGDSRWTRYVPRIVADTILRDLLGRF